MNRMNSSDDDSMMPTEHQTPSPSPPAPVAVKAESVQKVSLRFECPNNFQEFPVHERSQLTLEDATDKKELWLIRVPNNFDCTSLDGIEFNLRKRSQFSCGEKTYQAVAHEISENQTKGSTEVLLPNERGVLCSGPDFKGHVTVIESPALPAIKLPASPPSPKVELPTGMRQRYQPFGCSGTAKKTPEDSELGRNGNTSSLSSPTKEKKKKKKKKKSLDRAEGSKERILVKSEEETDSSFGNLSQSLSSVGEEYNSFTVKREATESLDAVTEHVKKKKKVKKEKR